MLEAWCFTDIPIDPKDVYWGWGICAGSSSSIKPKHVFIVLTVCMMKHVLIGVLAQVNRYRNATANKDILDESFPNLIRLRVNLKPQNVLRNELHPEIHT